MTRIKIITDSNSGITKEEAKEFDISVVPMPITIDGIEYKDGIDLFYEDAIARLDKGEIFKTSQPSPSDLITIWEEALKDHDEVLYLPLSSGLSGSCMNAYTLSQNYDGKVTIVDNKSVECILKMNIMEAVEMVKAGYSCAEIKEILEADFKENFAVIIPENVDTLKRGGRISPAVAALAGLLKICPLIKFSLGTLDLYDKVRTFKKAIKEAMDAVCNVENDKDEYYWGVIGAGFSKEEEEAYLQDFKEVLGKEDIQFYHFSPVVMAHTGNRTIGFARAKKHVITNK